FAQHLIEGVIDVEPANVSVAGPAEVIRLQIMIDHGADRRRPGDESVFVVVPAVVIEVPDKRELAGVTLPNQVLPENVRDVDLLLTRIKLVEIGISIFLAHIEGGEIVLPTVVVVVPKNPGAEIGIVKNEAAKIAH